MNFLKNKRGGEKIFSIWWFMVLAIVGLGIVGGVYVFYSAEIDLREIQAGTLNTKISDCILEQGVVTENFFENSFDVLEECDLNAGVFSKGSEYYLSVRFTNSSGKETRFMAGDSSMERNCEFTQEDVQKQLIAEEFPRCVKTEKDVVYYNKGVLEYGSLKILTASNQKGGRALEL